MRHRPIALSLLVSGILGMTACQSGERRQELAYVERPVEQLYNRGAEELDEQDYVEAIQFFNEVERQHPYSEWARQATLMTAFAHYRAREYEDSVNVAQRYISLHPGTDGAAYAYYIVGISYFEQIMDVGRDQKMTELARSALTDVVRRFPDTEFAKDATLKLDMVRDQLAGKEMEIGRWYLRRDQHLAAINRFKTVIEEYDQTSHVPEALHRLVEANLAIGLRGEARAAGAVLGYNFPDSDWYRDSYSLLSGEGIDPRSATAEEREGWLSRLF
ncbi:MAG: outer membrane protein assembly factor BamD [Alphaproteobacteria bacterium]|jgi:outer membrane protein assembly factor BamD|nr:outer membrane protein assembly factor BamD [Alphaproteobacteria bacterium]